MTQGLPLSRGYWNACLPILQRGLAAHWTSCAFGLVGEGSECFGFDDSISQDHDWGPAFCVWVPRAEFPAVSDAIERTLEQCPATFQGYPARLLPSRRAGRVGPFAIEAFYASFIGLDRPPQGWAEWRAIPEYALAACTNGEVFLDACGQFTAFREALCAYYPEELRRKKIAARCMIMAQAGQYNLPRSLCREALPAAMLSAARFAEAALSMVFLLNRRFMPFYKWAARMAGGLPVLGREAEELTTQLASTSFADKNQSERAAAAVEAFCAAVADQLRREGLTEVDGAWLWALGPSIQKTIKDRTLLGMDVMRD